MQPQPYSPGHDGAATPPPPARRLSDNPSADGDAAKADARKAREQAAMDAIDEASMESFPASDPPAYIRCHA